MIVRQGEVNALRECFRNNCLQDSKRLGRAQQYVLTTRAFERIFDGTGHEVNGVEGVPQLCMSTLGAS